MQFVSAAPGPGLRARRRRARGDDREPGRRRARQHVAHRSAPTHLGHPPAGAPPAEAARDPRRRGRRAVLARRRRGRGGRRLLRRLPDRGPLLVAAHRGRVRHRSRRGRADRHHPSHRPGRRPPRPRTPCGARVAQRGDAVVEPRPVLHGGLRHPRRLRRPVAADIVRGGPPTADRDPAGRPGVDGRIARERCWVCSKSSSCNPRRSCSTSATPSSSTPTASPTSALRTTARRRSSSRSSPTWRPMVETCRNSPSRSTPPSTTVSRLEDQVDDVAVVVLRVDAPPPVVV